MNGEKLFCSQIAKIKQRIVIRAVHAILLNASLIFLSFSIFFYVIRLAGFTNSSPDVRWHLVSGGLSLLAGSIIGLSARYKLAAVLIDIDRRLALRDRLSTAYEYFRFHPDNQFTGLLIHDAGVRLRPFKMKQIMPARVSLTHLAAVILLLINIFLYSGLWFSTGFKSTDGELEIIEQAGKILQNYSIRRIDEKADPDSPPLSEYAQTLAQFNRALRDGTKSFGQHVQALHQFREALQGERARLTGELGAKLDSAGIKALPGQPFSASQNLTASQLDRLKSFLDKSLNNRLPVSIGRDIAALQELYSIEKLVSRILKNLEGGRSTAETSDNTNGIERQLSPSARQTDTEIGGSTEKNLTRQVSGHSRTAKGPNGTTEAGKAGPDEDAPADEMNPVEGYAATAGRATSNAEKQAGDDLEKADGTLAQETIASSAAKSYLIQIRALTGIGEARLSSEEIFQTYRREVESILQKEDVPANYREYIKNYFFSIGIKSEEKAYETR